MPHNKQTINHQRRQVLRGAGGFTLAWLGIYQPSAARAEVSPVLSASPYDFHSRLAGKMNVLRGLDVPFYLGHHTGGFLGNYAASNYASTVTPFPTIDQVVAWSPSVYRSLTPKTRSMAPSPLSPACISYGRLNPSSLASNVAASGHKQNPTLDSFTRRWISRGCRKASGCFVSS